MNKQRLHSMRLLAVLPLLELASVCFAEEPSPTLLDDRWNTITASQVRPDADVQSDPHQGSSTWLAGSPEEQLRSDRSLNTLSRGGIFVPAMTDGISEPKFKVKSSDGEKTVAEGFTGNVAYVPGGDYTVLVGSLSGGEPLEFDVHVVEGSTTIIPVEWSGLQVTVVDDHATMIRGNYEIVSLPERAYVGLGTGALVNEGERMNTWLLWPGKYMLISVGEGYQARKNFITFELKPGELTRLTLVLDEETGDILGGGEIDDGTEITTDKWWDASLIIGGSVKFNSTRDVIGKASGNVFDVSGFIDTYFSMLLKKNFVYARLNAEIGGTIRIEDRPFFTTVDELKLELLYAYRVVDWFGPFVRFAFDSNMAPAWQEFASPYTVERLNAAGEVASTKLAAIDTRLSPAFSPITLKAGAGARFDAAVGTWFKLNARVGVMYRDVIAHDLFVVDELDDDLITLVPVESSSQVGAELALNFDLTPVRWFTLKADASILEPFKDWKKPIVDLDMDAAFRISSIASLSYSLELTYDPQMLDKVQLDQYVQLRFSYKVF